MEGAGTVVTLNEAKGPVFATATPISAPVMYKGDLTCFAVDQVNHRAWIGGRLTYSNDPSANPIFSVGHDAWFRMLDIR